MRYQIRKFGERKWSDCFGCDIYEAAEQFAEELDEDGDLVNGEEIACEVRLFGDEKIYLVVVYAEVKPIYRSRDLINEC